MSDRTAEQRIDALLGWDHLTTVGDQAWVRGELAAIRAELARLRPLAAVGQWVQDRVPQCEPLHAAAVIKYRYDALAAGDTP